MSFDVASLWSQPAFLKECELLQRERSDNGKAAPLQSGQRVARGFADLGYEEFGLIQGGKMVSLYTGKGSDFPEGHAHFFFPVLSADDLVNEITKAGIDIVSLDFVEQREWRVRAEVANTKELRTSNGATLEMALMAMLRAQ